MTETQPRERRRAPRVAADLPLQLSARDTGAPAKLKDLSTIGLSCSFPEALPEMTLVSIQIDVDGHSCGIEGAVVRCERERDGQWDVAVYFTGMQDESREKLEEFVESRLTESAGA